MLIFYCVNCNANDDYRISASSLAKASLAISMNRFVLYSLMLPMYVKSLAILFLKFGMPTKSLRICRLMNKHFLSSTVGFIISEILIIMLNISLSLPDSMNFFIRISLDSSSLK